MAEWKPFDRRNGTYHLPSDLYQEYSSNKTSQRPNDPFHGPSSELSQNDPFYAPNNPTGGSDVPIRLKVIFLFSFFSFCLASAEERCSVDLFPRGLVRSSDEPHVIKSQKDTAAMEGFR